jgi:hypothetical protein
MKKKSDEKAIKRQKAREDAALADIAARNENSGAVSCFTYIFLEFCPHN